MTSTKRIPIGGWDGAATRLAAVVEAHNAGAIALPPTVVSTALRAAELQTRAREATSQVAELEATTSGARDELVKRLAAKGPSSIDAPGAPLRAARLELATATEDRDLWIAAARIVDRAVRNRFVEFAGSIGDHLAEALTEVLDAARPDASLVAGVDWRDVDAIHEAPAPVADAFHRLQPLAARHDAIRAAGVGLYAELSISRPDGRSRTAAEFPIAAFIGHGVVGPVPGLRGTGSPEYASAWAWQPGTTHPVRRLAGAALDTARPDVAEPVDGEAVAAV